MALTDGVGCFGEDYVARYYRLLNGEKEPNA